MDNLKQLKNEETEECDKLIRRFLPDINQSYKGQESFDITENVKKYFEFLLKYVFYQKYCYLTILFLFFIL